MRVLCVAEKPSISKSITQILSGGRFTTHDTQSRFIKNYEFDYPQTRAFFTVTAVVGHLTETDFPDAFRKWHSCDSFDLFDAPVETRIAADKKSIEQNLLTQARQSDMLMIWTDCDREGEHIGMEIARVCRRAKPNIQVKRARFSAIIAQQIHNAAQNPVDLDRQQADAVAARIDLDLKVGAAFTRLQTLILQTRIPQIGEEKHVVSYGPCQFPTLGFVVQRYQLVKNFVPENFWYIYLSLTSQGDEETKFNWKRNHLFHQVAVHNLFEMIQGSVAVVTKVTQKETKKWKPLPLTTVELQKAASRLLKLSPKKALDLAEKLYQQGFVSYPRTETDEFDNQFDHMALIAKQTGDAVWGAFATSLQQGGFNAPRKGKHNDKAHPPIHPTGHASNLSPDEKKVYDYITRRYLACCSKDAVGMQTTVEVVCGGEEFSATGLVVKEKNYLEVFVYDKWSGHYIPDFEEGQEFDPTTCEVREGQTSKPNYLTEADLVTLMDKNGIGTDATIAQHIQTIIDRNYVIERNEGATKYLIPSTLGIGLIQGYNDIGLAKNVSKPQLRRETERRMVQVCEGTTTKNDMLTRSLDQYKEMYIIVRREFEKVTSAVRRYLSGQGDEPGGPAGGGGGGGGGGGNEGGSGGRGRPRGASSAARGARGGTRGRGRRRGGAPDSGTVISIDDSDDDDDFHAHPPPAQVSNSRSPTQPSVSSSSTSGHSRAPLSSSSTAVASTSRQTAPLYVSPTWQVTSVASTSMDTALNKPVSNRSTANCPDPPLDLNTVKCDCNKSAIQKTAQSGASAGKKYWNCSINACAFFQWVADPSSSNGIPAKRPYTTTQDEPSSSDSAKRKCGCNEDAILLTTKNGSNAGRKFWKCDNGGKCEFWEWDDKPAKSSWAPSGSSTMPGRIQSFNGGSGNDKSSDTCYKCNQTGHWASACPNGEISQYKRTKSFGTNTNDRPASGTCFKCNQPGHYSSACPNGASNNSKSNYSRPDSSSGSKGSCFTCGESGHWSSNCPGQQTGNGGNTRKSSYSGGLRRSRSASAPKAKRGRPSKKKSAFGAADDY